MTATFTDAIALRLLHKNAILLGVGNQLHLHTDVGSKVLPESLRLRGKVHGIECCTSVNVGHLLIYGENEFLLLECSESYQFKLLHRAQLTDWISAGKFLEDGQEFVLLTAHSVLLRFSYNTEDEPQQCSVEYRASCIDKSTLYCSYLHGNRWQELIIFGGNAFGELLVWQPRTDSGSDGVLPLLQRVVTHNGALFSIDYNEKFQILITTSDDRSIKFWQVDVQDAQNWAYAQVTPLTSGFGHVARVFQGKIIYYANQWYAITVGEDSYFCLWRNTGELMFKRRHHFGAKIWNFDYDTHTQTLFTADSAGNLLAYGLTDVLANSSSKLCTFSPMWCGKTADEYVAKIKFVTENLLIGVTSKNRLLCKRLPAQQTEQSWQLLSVGISTAAYKCTVLEVYQQLIAMCGYKRMTLLKYHVDSEEFVLLYDGPLLSGVIRAFQFLNAVTYLVSDELGQCVLLHGERLDRQCPIELPKCKEPWLTTALLLGNGYLMVSNRSGNLLLYVWQQQQAHYMLQHILKQPHGNLGATTLKIQEQSSAEIYIKSAGHDGSLRLLHLNKANAKLCMYAREHIPVAWVEQLLPADNASQWLALGFNDNHFVVWCRQRDLMLQVPCGGGHRCWHYAIYEDEKHAKWLQLAFIKKKQVLLHRLKLFNEIHSSIMLPVRNQWHVRPCNVMAVVGGVVRNKVQPILISAGDDNLIKVSTYRHQRVSEEQPLLLQLAEVHAHISNVRALKVLRADADYYLLFSGGGRAQFCINRLHLHSHRIQELQSHTLRPRQSTEPTNHAYSFDPETRIMAIDVLPVVATTASNYAGIAAKEYHIYLGCSDGYVRKLLLNASGQLTTQAEELHYGRCVLQLRLIADAYVLIAATDGMLSLYDLNLSSLQLRWQQHASGVNALDTLLSDELHVLTGGDDQAVNYSLVALVGAGAPKLLKSFQLPALHTAQVTAARLCDTPHGLLAYTSGIDQNLCRYNLTTRQLEHVYLACVADIKGLCLDTHQVCYLYGCGLQMHRFESK